MNYLFIILLVLINNLMLYFFVSISGQYFIKPNKFVQILDFSWFYYILASSPNIRLIFLFLGCFCLIILFKQQKTQIEYKCNISNFLEQLIKSNEKRNKMSSRLSTKNSALLLTVFLLATVNCSRLGGSDSGCNKTQNCAKFDCNHKCIKCDDGYFLTNDSNCLLLPGNCQAVDNNGVCTECDNGYQLDCNNKCIVKLPLNCQKVDNKGKCIKCKKGYTLYKSGKCVLELCAQYKQVEHKCDSKKCDKKCDDKDHNKCDDKADHKSCNLKGNHDKKCCKSNDKKHHKRVCIKCISGFYLDQTNNCVVLPKYCASAKPDGTCIQCIKGYQLDCNNKCIVKIPKCN